MATTRTNSIISIFETVAPFRLHLLVLFLVILAYVMSHVTITEEIVPGCVVPDFSTSGYTSQEALVWYEAIGEDGRSSYFWNYPIDLVIMATYTMLLGSQIYSSTLPAVVSYLPVVTACLDFIETTTHAHATFMYPKVQTDSIITIAGYATMIKHLCFQSSVLLSIASLVFWKKGQKSSEETKKKI